MCDRVAETTKAVARRILGASSRGKQADGQGRLL